jgi:hypothetical protein
MLNFKLAKTFPKPTIYAGYILILLGLLFFISQPLSLGISMVGIFTSFSYNGIQIDSKKRLYRSYSNIYGMKFGRWESLDSYRNLSVLRREDVYRAFSYSMSTMEERSVYYGIFLVNESQNKKVEIQRHGNMKDATNSAQRLSSKLSLELVQYKPKISSRSATKRRR